MSCGKILLCASGCASVFPSVTASRVLEMASLITRLGSTCSVILSAVSTGTPFSSSVESVRANWPYKFSFMTFPNTGALIFHWSILRLPSSVAWNRLKMM